MGESAAQTVREIEETRERLGSELRALEERFPPAKLARRGIAIATGTGVAGSAFWFVMRRARKKRTARKQHQESVAVVQLIPDQWASAIGRALEDDAWKGWLMMIGGAWLVLRLLELRQLRRLGRTMVAR